MSNKLVANLLKKTIRQEDGFVIRAAKCAGIHMENGPSYDSEQSFEMSTIKKSEDGEFDTTALFVKTDAFEYIDILLETFINDAEPFGDGSTRESVDHCDDDLRYLCRIYEREKAKGDDVGYAELTFFLNGNSSEIKIETAGQCEFKVGNLVWNGQLFLTK